MPEFKRIDPNTITEGDRIRQEYPNIDSLAESIRQHGLECPIGVRDAGDGTYLLIHGGRRLRACTQAELSEVPVMIYPKDTDELESKILELLENIEREDLTWQEKLEATEWINRLHITKYGEKITPRADAEGWSMADTAKLLGKSASGVSTDIQLAEALKEIPMLRECKNKSDALKAFDKLRENIIIAELAKRLESRRAETSYDTQLLKLCDSFITSDFLEAVQKLPDGCIDFADVDPPWGVNINTLPSGTDFSKAKGEVYLEGIKPDAYIKFLSTLFENLYRVMSDNSWIVMWFAPHPWFEVVHSLILKAGFKCLRTPGIWYKHNAFCAFPRYALTPDYEFFFYARKGDPGIVKQGRSIVFDFLQSKDKSHPTEKPIDLMQEILQTFCTQAHRVLVPFLGSGNTLLAASNLNMQAFGYELNADYKSNFIFRVHQGRPGSY